MLSLYLATVSQQIKSNAKLSRQIYDRHYVHDSKKMDSKPERAACQPLGESLESQSVQEVKNSPTAALGFDTRKPDWASRV